MDINLSQEGHPLVATLARTTAINTNFYADVGELEGEWFSATAFTNQNSTALKAALDHQAASHPTIDARTKGSFFIGEYAWYVPAIAIAAYLAEKRVPEIAADNLALRYSKYTWHEGKYSGEGERIDARFLSGRFAVLPDDPAANHPDAIVLQDADAMRGWLRVRLEAHLAPLIEAIHAMTRFGRQPQWNLVADACAALFLSIGKTIKDETRSQAEGLAFVKAEGSPLKNARTGYVNLKYEDFSQTHRARGGCCRYYVVDENSVKCSTCVLRTAEERDQILLRYMAEEYAQRATS